MVTVGTFFLLIPRHSMKHLIRLIRFLGIVKTHKVTNLHREILCSSGRSSGVTKILWLPSKAGYLEIDLISAYHEITENLAKFLRLSILVLFPEWWKLSPKTWDFFLGDVGDSKIGIPKLPGDVGSFLQQLAKAWGPEKGEDCYHGSGFFFRLFFRSEKKSIWPQHGKIFHN